MNNRFNLWARLVGCLLWAAFTMGVAASPAAGQQRGVYPDDSVTARDALVRVRELHASGNTIEAVRVLQMILDGEAERLLPAAGEQGGAGVEATDLFYPVRTHAAAMLLAMPDLLAAYRLQVEPTGAELLKAGELARVERTMFLTPSGFEATLRLAQLELESANFESARLYLEQLEQHPDRASKSAGAQAASRLLSQLAGYLPRARLVTLASKWATEAGEAASQASSGIAYPPDAKITSRSPLDSQVFPKELPSSPVPLQSVAFEPLSGSPREVVSQGPAEESGFSAFANNESRGPTSGSWVFPTYSNEVVYATDGLRIGAWDAATLAPIWTAQPTGRSLTQIYSVDDSFQFGMSSARAGIEDAASVAVKDGAVVFAGGVAFTANRVGDNTLYALEAATGARRWAVDISLLDLRQSGQAERQSAASIRGNPIISSGTVVVAVRRAGQTRRINSLYLVGFDVYTGAVKWTRLVGSHGTNPWARTNTRPDGLLLYHGVVYRSDDMGITGAYEAATGRPVWVRLSPTKSLSTFGSPAEEMLEAFATHRPVAVDESIFVIEPNLAGEPGRVIRLDAATGALTASRDGLALNGPLYLLQAGDYLAAVGATRVAFVRSNMLGEGTVRLSESLATHRIAGRAVAAGGKLLLPLDDALLTINPAEPTDSTRSPMSTSGNLIVAGGEGTERNGAAAAGGGAIADDAATVGAKGGEVLGSHVVVADNRGVHSYLGWASAQRLLNERIVAAKDDPSPILTYVDLCTRVGKAAAAPELIDKALVLINRMTDTDAASVHRRRLFAILSETLAQSREALNVVPAVEGESAAAGGFARPPVSDLGVLDQLLDRMTRAADGPAQAVHASFERAWLRVVQLRYTDAVEAYQTILIDKLLAQQPVSSDSVLVVSEATLPSVVAPAGAIARASLIALLTQQGPGVYSAFDEEAAREASLVTTLTGQAAATRFEELAQRYPVASVTPQLWHRAGDALREVGKTGEARAAYGAGVSAAELSATIGRPDQTATLSLLTSLLCDLSNGPDDAEAVFHLMMRLSSEYPSMQLQLTSGSVAPAEYAQRLLETLLKRTELARVGTARSSAALGPPRVQALAGWEPVAPICKRLVGTPHGSLLMQNRTLSRLGYWATDALNGELKLVWSRKFESLPSVVSLSAMNTVLFLATPSGGYLESVRNAGGKREVGISSWKSQDFSSLFAPVGTGEGVISDRFNTPTDGTVRREDMLVLAAGDLIALVQRRGLAAVFSARTGQAMWREPLDVNRVFEAEFAGNHLVIAGTYLNKTDGRYLALVVSHNAQNGSPGGTLTNPQLGDHPRWLRATGKGDCLVASAMGLQRFDPASGSTLWRNDAVPAMKSSLGAWVVGDWAYILTAGPQLLACKLADGVMQESEVNTRERLQFPLAAWVNAGTLITTGEKGFAILGADGALLGVDALEQTVELLPPAVAASTIFAMETQTLLGGTDATADTARLFCFEQPTGRLLSIQRVRLFDAPTSLTLLDGKVIVVTPTVTLVIDQP